MLFQTELDRIIHRWNEGNVDDEWEFQQLRDSSIAAMSNEEAWSQMPVTIEKLTQQCDESTAVEVLETVLALSRRSDTTEIPSSLLTHRLLLEQQFAAFGPYANQRLLEMFKHYRLTGSQ